MNRSVSPIRHDYRPGALREQRSKKHGFFWFTLGMGLPLLTLWFALGFTSHNAQAVVDPAGSVAATTTFPPEVAADADTATRGTTDTTGLPSLDDPLMAIDAVIAVPPQLDYVQVALTIRPGDTLDQLFRKHSLSIGDLSTIARLPAARDQLRLLRPGDVIAIRHDNGRIRELTKEIDYANMLAVKYTGDGVFDAEISPRAIEVHEAMRHGVIETSLFESAAQAGLDDSMIMNLAGIFAWDIDFVLDIRAGDQYYILFEEIWRDGRRVADGEIIAAEFINNGRIVRAIRHIDAEGESDYFAPDGRSVRKAFIRAPVDFTRISSNFNPRRRHPVLNSIRAHRGVDYAAPKGTPIMASGDGKVIFRGRHGGYGNAVIIQHGGNITTLYAHLSNFAKNARLGSRVRQGQTIGFVGATGLATAAHLHYEYRVNGVHRNPRTVKLPAAEPINDRYKNEFEQNAAAILERLERYKQTRLAHLN